MHTNYLIVDISVARRGLGMRYIMFLELAYVHVVFSGSLFIIATLVFSLNTQFCILNTYIPVYILYNHNSEVLKVNLIIP